MSDTGISAQSTRDLFIQHFGQQFACHVELKYECTNGSLDAVTKQPNLKVIIIQLNIV